MSHRRTKPQGQSRKYSVLVGRIKDGQEDPEGAGKSPHYEIWVDARGRELPHRGNAARSTERRARSVRSNVAATSSASPRWPTPPD